MRDDSLDIVVLDDQLSGGFGADAIDAGDVVGGVSCESKNFRNLRWTNAELLNYLGRLVALVLHGVPDRDVVTHKLHQVFVA